MVISLLSPFFEGSGFGQSLFLCFFNIKSNNIDVRLIDDTYLYNAVVDVKATRKEKLDARKKY